MTPVRLHVEAQDWPLRSPFRISRGSKTHARVVTVTLTSAQHTGRGECVPYARFGETVEGVIDKIEAARMDIERGLSIADIQRLLPAGAARNALDCAAWDLAAKTTGRRAWELAGLPPPGPAATAITVSLADPATMADAAIRAGSRLLKVKLGGDDDLDCLKAVRKAAPAATLIVDPNEAWDLSTLQRYMPTLQELGVALIEQPLPASADSALDRFVSPIPLCADESLRVETDLPLVDTRYGAVNIKLDKTGGLTAALHLAREAQNSGLIIMIGSMVATSLSMAPAFMLSGLAHFIDLDSPMLLSTDRDPAMPCDGATLFAPPPELWG